MSLFTIALIGNPNCGKTTLFNNLTGAHQKVGNWPGVTVEKKSGTMMLGDQSVEIVDLPGIYSLEQDYLGLDEIIARDFLRQESYDLVINIIDDESGAQSGADPAGVGGQPKCCRCLEYGGCRAPEWR